MPSLMITVIYPQPTALGRKSETILNEVAVHTLYLTHFLIFLNRGPGETSVLDYINSWYSQLINIPKGELEINDIPLHTKLDNYHLQESQDRTQKYIKEDLKESSNAYNDYAEGTLPKLKHTYLHKCQDVEDHKAAAAAPNAHQAPPVQISIRYTDNIVTLYCLRCPSGHPADYT